MNTVCIVCGQDFLTDKCKCVENITRNMIDTRARIPKLEFESIIDEFTSYWDSGKTHMGDEYSILEKLLSKYIKII